MQGSEISTYTDGSGSFEITLPTSLARDSQFEEGVFTLYSYLANYGIGTATVLVKNGEFVYSRGDVDSNGELLNKQSLVKLLNINTEVQPNLVEENYNGTVSVSVSVRALFDSVTIAIPKLLSNSSDALIFSNINTGQTFVPKPNHNSTIFSPLKVGPEEEVLQYDFFFTPGFLPEGAYQVVPFLLVEQEDMPQGLLESLGLNMDDIGPDFLNIPYRRDGGQFEILE